MRTNLRIGAAFVELAGQTAVDVIGMAVVPRAIVDIPPRPLRQALLALRPSMQGRIPEILGDDEEERIETLMALLDGSSEDDLNALLAAAVEALSRLEAEKRCRSSHRDRSDRRRERRRSAAGIRRVKPSERY